MDPERTSAAVAAANAVADDLEAGLGLDPDVPRFSLCFGEAGFALLFDALGRAGLRPGGREHARELLRAASRGVNGGRANASLYVGWPGVAFATSVVCEPDEARQSLRSSLAVLRRGVAKAPWRGRLDLTDGLAGLGVLALRCLPDGDAEVGVASVVERLDELAEPLGPGLAWTSEPDRLGVGVAHGVAGIVLFLAEAHEAGIAQERAERLLDGAAEWLLSLPPGEDGRRFPAFPLARPAESSAMPNAWCWGDVGVALALARAGQVRARDDWRQAAVDAALAAAVRQPDELGVGDACFCHGSAGVAHVLRALGAVTGDERFTDAALRWLDRTLAERRPGEGVGGFMTAMYPWRPEAGNTADGSLQLGAAGTALALLAACGLGDTGWGRAFLVPSAP